jgi:hypothetical protein
MVWLPERLATLRSDRYDEVRPDGYGQWTENGRTIGFFLEHDTGTESLTKVTDKISGYQQYPVTEQGMLLFSVHSTRREIALRAALEEAFTRSRRDAEQYRRPLYDDLPIATAPRDHRHPAGPAGPVWALWAPHQPGVAPARRYRLAELAAARTTAAATRQPLASAGHGDRGWGTVPTVDEPTPDNRAPAVDAGAPADVDPPRRETGYNTYDRGDNAWPDDGWG